MRHPRSGYLGEHTRNGRPVTPSGGTPWGKPLPVADELTAPYWEGARRHELVLLRCSACGTFIHPPRAACRNCQRRQLVPTAVPPHGVIYSYTITYMAFAPGFADEVPYVLVLVGLDVQPSARVLTILRDCSVEDVVIGMPVEFVFDDVTDDITLPVAVPDPRPRPVSVSHLTPTAGSGEG
jgi:uncharacterized protein